MGRRALPKIDPSLDLSRHLMTLEQLPRPWSNEAIFGRDAPLEIEVGSGKGLFMQGAASQRPEHNFLGIEISEKYARFSAARLKKAELGNACMLAGTAEYVFQTVLPKQAARAVHVYFPDPWWKRRHHKRRVMNRAFVAQVQRVLMPGGSLHFWTDVEAYFRQAVKTVVEATSLVGPLPVAEPSPEHDLDYHSHFERRTRLQGRSVYRSEFCKPAE